MVTNEHRITFKRIRLSLPCEYHHDVLVAGSNSVPAARAERHLPDRSGRRCERIWRDVHRCDVSLAAAAAARVKAVLVDLAAGVSECDLTRSVGAGSAVALDEVLAVGGIGQTRNLPRRCFPTKQPHHRQPAHARTFAEQQVAGQEEK